MYVLINGYAVPYEQLPCSKCTHRYAYVCPMCYWNLYGHYDTYKDIDPRDAPKGIATFKEAIANANTKET